jgi:STE24 endopeptidase
MHEIIFWIIITILVLDFLFENYLEYLNTKRMGTKLPDELKGIFDEEKYAKQQAYQKENHRFGMISGTFSFLIILAMFAFYGFAFVDSIAWNITSHAILAALLFFGLSCLLLTSSTFRFRFTIHL